MPQSNDRDRVTWMGVTQQIGSAKDALRNEWRDLERRHHEDMAGLRSEIIRGFANLEERFNGHEQWHRDQLANTVASGPGRISSWLMVAITALSVIVAVVSVAVTHTS